MENEFLKEPWAFLHTKTNSTKEEDSTVFSAWEENFQDLSGWCMDTFQGQCDFHIGESTTLKLSGTKYEGKDVSTSEEEGVLKGLRSTIDDDKRDLKMDNVKMTEESSDNRHLLLSPSELVKGHTTECHNEENNISSSWLMSPESTASTSTSSSKRRNTDVSLLQFEHRTKNDLEYARPISFDPTPTQREWDELRTIETTGSDTFDLLSYLCDDEIRSPEGSVSTDSSAILKLRSLATPSIFSSASIKIKTEENNELPTRRRMETRASSTVTLSSIEAPVTSSRRSERTRNMALNKEKEKSITRVKREKSGKKRYYESDSDDDISVSQYRESREKNNEASRKSRMNKKAKESEMSVKAVELEKDNRILKMKVEELEKLVTSMRSALLRSALKKEL